MRSTNKVPERTAFFAAKGRVFRNLTYEPGERKEWHSVRRATTVPKLPRKSCLLFYNGPRNGLSYCRRRSTETILRADEPTER